MAVITHDPEKQLAWEARHRPRAGIAALVGALGLLLYFVLEQIVLRDIPNSSGLESFIRATQSGNIDDLQSLRTPYFEYLDTKNGILLFRAFCGFFGFIGLAWAAGFLAVAIRGRAATFRRFVIYLPIVGGVVLGIGVLISQLGTEQLISDFLASPRRVRDATVDPSGLNLFAGVLIPLGSMVLAVGLVLVSLNAMRAGLLTKLMGYIGIVAGAMLIIFPLPIVHVFWLAACGVLFLGRWPGGDPPAWRTGKAEPWAVAPPQPRGGRRAVAEPTPATPATPGAPAARRKRKKRS